MDVGELAEVEWPASIDSQAVVQSDLVLQSSVVLSCLLKAGRVLVEVAQVASSRRMLGLAGKSTRTSQPELQDVREDETVDLAEAVVLAVILLPDSWL